MESISPNEQQNVRLEKFTDDELDELLRDLNEFQNTVGSGGTTSIREFVDSFFTNNINAHPLQNQFNNLLHDFEDFETKMLPPCQRNPTSNTKFNYDQGFRRELQECEGMIEEMAEGTEPFVMGNFRDSTLTMNITSDVGAGYNIRGSGFGGPAEFVGAFVRYFHCKQSSRVNELANISRRKKRKYRGRVETEEETACRLELTRIRNREAAARAHEKKVEREARLKTQLEKQRKKNEFLRNLLTFLDEHNRIDVPPEPLRRTISGPI